MGPDKDYSELEFFAYYDPKEQAHRVKIIKDYVHEKKEIESKLKPKHVLVNGDVTTIVWKDGTHTIVKKAEGDHYDIEKAILWAIIKKAAGNNASFAGKYIKEFTDLVVVQPEKKKKRKLNANDVIDILGRFSGGTRRSQLDGEEGKQE